MGDSIDELKEVVAQSLEASGVLAKLRAQIRKHVFDVIDEQDRGTKTLVENEKLASIRSGISDKFAFDLVREFLDFFELDYASSVLHSEARVEEELVNRSDLGAQLKLPRTLTDRPLLWHVLESHLSGARSNPHATSQVSPNSEPSSYLTSAVPQSSSSFALTSNASPSQAYQIPTLSHSIPKPSFALLPQNDSLKTRLEKENPGNSKSDAVLSGAAVAAVAAAKVMGDDTSELRGASSSPTSSAPRETPSPLAAAAPAATHSAQMAHVVRDLKSRHVHFDDLDAALEDVDEIDASLRRHADQGSNQGSKQGSNQGSESSGLASLTSLHNLPPPPRRTGNATTSTTSSSSMITTSASSSSLTSVSPTSLSSSLSSLSSVPDTAGESTVKSSAAASLANRSASADVLSALSKFTTQTEETVKVSKGMESDPEHGKVDILALLNSVEPRKKQSLLGSLPPLTRPSDPLPAKSLSQPHVQPKAPSHPTGSKDPYFPLSFSGRAPEPEVQSPADSFDVSLDGSMEASMEASGEIARLANRTQQLVGIPRVHLVHDELDGRLPDRLIPKISSPVDSPLPSPHEDSKQSLASQLHLASTWQPKSNVALRHSDLVDLNAVDARIQDTETRKQEEPDRLEDSYEEEFAADEAEVDEEIDDPFDESEANFYVDGGDEDFEGNDFARNPFLRQQQHHMIYQRDAVVSNLSEAMQGFDYEEVAER